MNKTVIFDFDGTIADSFEVVLAIFCKLTGRQELPKAAEIEHLRQMPILKVAAALKIPRWRVPFLLMRGRKEMERHILEVAPFPGIATSLSALRENGCRLYIVSSNSTRNVERFLAQHQLAGYFDDVYGGVSIFGKAKVLRHIMHRHKLQTQQCIYVGDEARDILAARKAGVKCIAAVWGFSAAAPLAAQQPYAVADGPEYLPEIVRTWRVNEK